MKYKEAGVDILGSNQVLKEIKELAGSTYDKNVLAGIGPFGAMYDLSEIKEYKQPILVQSIDGVGTKLRLAKKMNVHFLFGIGMDIVNHCLNDILCQGAKPLTFLDYIAQDRLRKEEIVELLRGMAFACKPAKISLIGGEIAQMPGIYQKEELDVVGQIIGIVERERVIDGSEVKPGDKIIGLLSSGPHTNGYSLIRKIIKKKKYSLYSFWPELGGLLGQALLAVHKSYLKSVSLVLDQFEVHGICHITGGGLIDNIARVLPEGCQVQIHLGSWPVLPIFHFIHREGGISVKEMHQVFNMGIGMVLIVSRENFKAVRGLFWENREPCYIIGEIGIKDSL